MRKPLLRAVAVRFRKILFTMALISAVCCSFVVAMINAYGSLKKNFDTYLADYGIADAVISTETTSGSIAEKLSAVPGIARVESRLTATVQFYTPSGRMLVGYVATLHDEEIQKLHRWEQETGISGNYVLVDRYFARRNGLSTGNELLVRHDGETRTFRIGAIVSSPETITGAKLEGLGGYYSDVGYVYVPASLLAAETQREFDRMMAEWEEKQDEFTQLQEEARQAWERGEKELENARTELEDREQEFEDSKKDLKGKIRDLTSARLQLVLGRKDLDDAEATAAERKEQLREALARAEEQLLELEDRQAELEEARNDISSLVVRLEDARGRLIVARNQLSGAESQLQVTLTAMREAKNVWDRVNAGEGTDVLPELIGSQVDISAGELEEKLEQRGITPETLDETIRQAESGTSRLQTGSDRVQNAIRQITRDYMPELMDYLEEIEQGLEVIAGSRTALADGIVRMEDGLQAILDFETEAPENRELLENKLREVEDALRVIYDGIAEGEGALAGGREQLDEETEKAARTRQEAEDELSEGEESLNAALEELNAWEGYSPLRNEFLLMFDPGVTDRQSVLDAAVDALDGIATGSVLYEDSTLRRRISDNLDPWVTMASFLPLIFTGLVLLVLFLFLSMMIRQSRRECGILRALGFEAMEIRKLFCAVCFLMMIPALFLGAGLSFPLLDIFNRYYQAVFTFPDAVQVFDWKMFGLFAAVMIAVTQLAALVTTSSINSVHPAEIMRRQPFQTHPRSRRGDRLLRRLGPMAKLSLKSLGRNKLRFYSSAACIAAAAAIIFACMAFLVSTEHIETEIFDLRIRYDGQVLFSGKPDEALAEEIRALPCVRRLEPVRAYSPRIAFGDREVNVSVMAVSPDTELLAVPDLQGNVIPVPESGIILEESAAEQLGARPGDTVAADGVPLTVAALSRQAGNLCSYISDTQAEALGDPEQYTWMVSLEGDAEQLLAERLEQEDCFVMTIWTGVLRSSVHEFLQLFAIYAWIGVGFSVLVGMLILVTTNQTNLLEQKRELSILRAMGFQHSEISRHWFTHSLLYLLCALGFGIPLGLWIAKTAFRLLTNDSRHFIYIPDSFQYLWTFGILLLFLAAAHVWSMRSMKKWDLAESIRDTE